MMFSKPWKHVKVRMCHSLGRKRQHLDAMFIMQSTEEMLGSIQSNKQRLPAFSTSGHHPSVHYLSLPWRETVLDRQVVSGGLLLWLKLMDAAMDGQPKLSKSDSLWSLQSCVMTRRNGSLETDARQWQHSGGEVLCCRGFHQPWLFLPSSIWRAAFASFL